MKPRKSGQKGQALVEFVIAFPICLVFVFSIWQICLLYNADHLAQLAAFQAVRQGAILIPQDLSHSGGSQRNAIAMGVGDKKFDGIHNAAAMALTPASPKWSQVFRGGMPDTELKGSGLEPFLPEPMDSYIERLAYAKAATTVELEVQFRDRPGRRALNIGEQVSLSGDEVLIATVTYRAYLSIPLNGWRLAGRVFQVGEGWGAQGSSGYGPRDGSTFVDVRAEAALPLEGFLVPN